MARGRFPDAADLRPRDRGKALHARAWALARPLRPGNEQNQEVALNSLKRFHHTPEARVLLVSLRDVIAKTSRCANYEIEDVITAIDDVDAFAFQEQGRLPHWVTRVIWGRPGRRLPALRRLAARLRRPSLERDYEMMFISCQSPNDLYLLGPLDRYRDRCKKLVVYVDELWARSIPDRPGELTMLAQFDQVLLGQEAPVAAAEAAIGRPVSYIPYGLDVPRFSPFPDPPARTIDVFNMGRRSPVTHAAFLRLADERRWMYLHDTRDGGGRVLDAREHRLQLAAHIKRARYFVTNVPKITRPEETGGQQEVGFRFFEGAAAGAVMIGDAPRCPSFDQHFNWEDAVVHMPYGTSDPAAVIDELEGDPARVARIRRRNAANALRRHDWVYRWERVLASVGLEPTPRARQRREALCRLAEEIEAADVARLGRELHAAA